MQDIIRYINLQSNHKMYCYYIILHITMYLANTILMQYYYYTIYYLFFFYIYYCITHYFMDQHIQYILIYFNMYYNNILNNPTHIHIYLHIIHTDIYLLSHILLYNIYSPFSYNHTTLSMGPNIVNNPRNIIYNYSRNLCILLIYMLLYILLSKRNNHLCILYTICSHLNIKHMSTKNIEIYIYLVILIIHNFINIQCILLFMYILYILKDILYIYI